MSYFKQALSRISKGPKGTPRNLEQKVCQDFFGQNEARRIACTAAQNHMNRVNNPDAGEVQSTNMIFAGPTGCGKTHLARRLAQVLDVPLYLADATALTADGYVGQSVQSVLLGLLRAADDDQQRAENGGIIVIDEIDKCGSKGGSGVDVGRTEVQNALLKYMQGQVVTIEDGIGSYAEPIDFDTSNVLFILSGSFSEMMQRYSMKADKEITGFAGESTRKRGFTYADITADHLCAPNGGGLLPEMVGRCPIVVPMGPLSRDNMHEILLKGSNSAKRRAEVDMGYYGIEVTWDDDALAYMLDVAEKKNLGARGLNACDKILLQYGYILPSTNEEKIHFTKDMLVNPQKYLDEFDAASEDVTLEGMITDTTVKYIKKVAGKSDFGFRILANYTDPNGLNTPVALNYLPEQGIAKLNCFFEVDPSSDDTYEVVMSLKPTSDQKFQEHGIYVLDYEDDLSAEQVLHLKSEMQRVKYALQTDVLIEAFEKDYGRESLAVMVR